MIDVHAGAQLAKLRGQRLSMLSRIGLGELIWPWMWPIHMIGVGSRSQRIERIPGASLALTGGSGGEAADRKIRRIGIAAYAAQGLGMLAAVVTALLTTGAAQLVAWLIAVALYGPVLIEGAALTVNLIIRPGQLTLNRRRKQLAKGGQVVLILTSYVRDPKACPRARREDPACGRHHRGPCRRPAFLLDRAGVLPRAGARHWLATGRLGQLVSPDAGQGAVR